jgi:hypothetical protein
MDVCRESTLQLLNFAEAIAIGSLSRLPAVLKVVDRMGDLIIPEFKSLFRDQYSESLQNEVTTICKRLGGRVIGILMESVNLIKESPNGKLNFRGVPHSITSYVDYLLTASRSWETLEQVSEGDNGEPLKEYLKMEDRVSYDLMREIMNHITEVSVIKEDQVSDNESFNDIRESYGYYDYPAMDEYGCNKSAFLKQYNTDWWNRRGNQSYLTTGVWFDYWTRHVVEPMQTGMNRSKPEITSEPAIFGNRPVP